MNIAFLAGWGLGAAGLSLVLMLAEASAQPAGLCQQMQAMQRAPSRTPSASELARHPLGSRGNPVRAEMPPGQHAYLGRLVCSDGKRPTNIQRVGSFGGNPHGSLMDLYTLSCGARQVEVYMDMYHCGYVENRPIPGFRLRPSP